MVRRKVRTAISQMAIMTDLILLSYGLISKEHELFNRDIENFLREKQDKGYLCLGSDVGDYDDVRQRARIFYTKIHYVYLGKKKVLNEDLCVRLREQWSLHRPKVMVFEWV